MLEAVEMEQGIIGDGLRKLIEKGANTLLEVGMNTPWQILALTQMLIDATEDKNKNVCQVASKLLNLLKLATTLPIQGVNDQNENARLVVFYLLDSCASADPLLTTGTKEESEDVRSVASEAPACQDTNNLKPITDQSFRQGMVKSALSQQTTHKSAPSRPEPAVQQKRVKACKQKSQEKTIDVRSVASNTPACQDDNHLNYQPFRQGMVKSALSQQTTHKSAPSRPEPAVQQKKVEACKQKSQEKTIDVRNLGYYRITLTTFVKALRQRILGIWYGNQVKERQLQITEQQLQITKQQLRIKKQELKITEQQLQIKKQQLQQDPCQGRESKQDSAQPAEANSAMINSPVIGAAVWERYFGDVDLVPPLPKNIGEILNSSCPFWENKTVQETHLLVLIPAQVAGKPLTLDYLGELIQSPEGYGRKAQYTNYWCKAYPAIGNQSLDRSYWVLMTKDVLPESCDKSYQEQRALVAEYANGTGLAYKVPKALEAAVVMSLQHVRSGQRLYGEDEDYWKYTRCRKDQIIVGFSPSEGLIVDGIKPEYQEPRCGVRVLLPLIYPLDIVEQA